MKRKLISTVAALAMTASMSMPVFAAQTNDTQTSDVPVVGNIGRWKDGKTDINNPKDINSGDEGENGEVQKPTNLTDINVTVPTSMTFDVVTNTKDSNPVFASAAYSVTNNGTNTITVEGEYNVTKAGNITLVDTDKVFAKAGDGKIDLGLSLNADGKPFIEKVINKARSSKSISLSAKNFTKLGFTSNEEGMADVKQEALAGTFADSNEVTQGNLVLTFTAQN
ncbi:hypothetical protein ACRTDB_003123 [Clostridium perfringens]